jgi:hypothetical protein
MPRAEERNQKKPIAKKIQNLTFQTFFEIRGTFGFLNLDFLWFLASWFVGS